jgi:organic radical activating enzyme
MDYYKSKLGKDRFSFFMAGGEPTLIKELGYVIEEIKRYHDVYFTIVSNGSRTLRWWEKHGDKIDNIHLTHHISQSNVKHITEVADILYEKNVKTTVKVLMDPLYWNKGIEDINYMKSNSKYPWFIMVAKVIEQDDKINVSYTKEQMSFLEKDLKRIPNFSWFWKNRNLIKDLKLWESTAIHDNGKKTYSRPGTYINNGWNNFEGWKCSIGLDRIYVNWEGQLTGSCNAKLYGLDYYYSILDENFKEKFNPELKQIICPFKSCGCMPETHENKEKIIV